ncbi:hypothetical protein LINPERHAP1_LOCUS35013 [Linum perenne]
MDFRPDELPVLLCDRSPSSSNFGSSNFFVVDRCEIPFCSVYLTLAVLQFSEALHCCSGLDSLLQFKLLVALMMHAEDSG